MTNQEGSPVTRTQLPENFTWKTENLLTYKIPIGQREPESSCVPWETSACSVRLMIFRRQGCHDFRKCNRVRFSGVSYSDQSGCCEWDWTACGVGGAMSTPGRYTNNHRKRRRVQICTRSLKVKSASGNSAGSKPRHGGFISHHVVSFYCVLRFRPVCCSSFSLNLCRLITNHTSRHNKRKREGDNSQRAPREWRLLKRETTSGQSC